MSGRQTAEQGEAEPGSSPAARAHPAPGAAVDPAEHAALLDEWCNALAHHPGPTLRLRPLLAALTDRLLRAAATGAPTTAAAEFAAVGRELAANGLADADAIGATVSVVGSHLLTAAAASPAEAAGFAHLQGILVGAALEAAPRPQLPRPAAIPGPRTPGSTGAPGLPGRDPLTGLTDRAGFHERLAAVFRDAPPGARLGLCYLDLDGFKEVNDTAGHQVGDELLTRVARRLHDALAGPGRLVARLGGDEFVVLLERSSGPADAEWVARTALRAADCAFGKPGQEVRITASAGVVERPVAGTDAADAMRAADMTLYWAKAAGKGRFAVFDAQRDARQTARYRLGAQLPRALERGEFFVLYQPIVRLPDGFPVAAEALVRWRHPEHGVLAPGQFIHLAEDNGMIAELGRFVLEKACRQAEAWRRRDPARAPSVSVNLSPRQCADEGLAGEVDRVLRETGLPPERLQLELTESAVIEGHRSPESLRELSALGIRLALDDFGTGYSSLAYLRTLPVDALKLDRSFAEGLRGGEGLDGVDARIVAALTQLARALTLTVTVEGVETAAQAYRLARLGCELGQGLLFGGPGPAGAAGPLDAAAEPDALHVGEQAVGGHAVSPWPGAESH
ncbi:hypothetical protein BIV57_19640 [Mangrovactinospora gilvigrisea]|uniref:GGDEF-domain containing protein n=1 Tax=Mangrovactinospora gilvigrisea TaxID=1428644 RepID=A0A1J7C2P2_9ACTN|nr:bifunctional diguanylate cyclase/phosphodiesterase [Mangrovactinospora gilvigrisea]OIV35832.1 hypothetical protein BIV57_19640 [Mangrovactinospora gilvigrisea]